MIRRVKGAIIIIYHIKKRDTGKVLIASDCGAAKTLHLVSPA
jgi:hypothetical protein